MKLEHLEVLTVIETEEYRSFQEKIDITKKHDGKNRVYILDNYVAIERKELAN